MITRRKPLKRSPLKRSTKPVKKVRSKPRPGRIKGKDLQAQRIRIFERDKGLCHDCGIPVLFNAPEEWDNSFHRAHLRGKRNFGDDDSNVKTSCGKCHRAHHAGHKPVPPKSKSEEDRRDERVG
jgi:5-methylcytosine-specific restriction endonuclease McrA